MPARLSNTAYTDVPWRAHEVSGDFQIEDVWAVHTPGGGPDDFPTMLEAVERYETSRPNPALLGFLLAVRWKLGALFGWDARETGLGERVFALREGLPEDLRTVPRGSDRGLAPFTPVYQLPDEAVLELANKTVHTAMHLGWAQDDNGGHELRMTVLVKPNGLMGRLYLAAIAPIRHLVVLPIFLRRWEHAWRDATAEVIGAGTIRGLVGVDEIPSATRTLSSLPVTDYADQFTRSTDIQASPEDWAPSIRKRGSGPHNARRQQSTQSRMDRVEIDCGGVHPPLSVHTHNHPDQQDGGRLRCAARRKCCGAETGLHPASKGLVQPRVMLTNRRISLDSLSQESGKHARRRHPDIFGDLVQWITRTNRETGQHRLELVVEHRLEQSQLVSEMPRNGTTADTGTLSDIDETRLPVPLLGEEFGRGCDQQPTTLLSPLVTQRCHRSIQPRCPEPSFRC